jgi:zinc protease
MIPRLSLRNLAALSFAGALAACAGSAPPAQAPAAAVVDTPAAPRQTREAPPPPLPLKPVEFPGFRETTLPNGLRLIVVEKHDLPVVNVNLYVKSGSAADPLQKVGLSEMTAELLTKGTPGRTAKQIAETIEGVGGQLSADAGLDYTTVSASVLADQLPLAFNLVSDVALRPTFPQDELETARKRTLSALEVALSRPGEIAQRRLVREIYGETHPYGVSSLPQTVRAIDRADLVRFHQQHFRADNALLVVSGDVNAAEVETLARGHFGGWKGGFGATRALADPPAREKAQVTLVHRPGSVQSNILVGHVGIRPDNPDYFPLQVLNKIVGGGTDSRLFLILREQKGWTYGAYSRLSRPKEVGYYVASAEVRTEVTDSALVELMHQLRRAREEPVSREELEAAKSFLVGSFPLRIETAGQIASQVAQTRLLGLPVEDLLRYRERINAVTAEDVQRVAREYIRPDQAVIVVVGDATRVADKLEKVAPVVLFDVEGRRLDSASLQGK